MLSNNPLYLAKEIEFAKYQLDHIYTDPINRRHLQTRLETLGNELTKVMAAFRQCLGYLQFHSELWLSIEQLSEQFNLSENQIAGALDGMLHLELVQRSPRDGSVKYNQV